MSVCRIPGNSDEVLFVSPMKAHHAEEYIALQLELMLGMLLLQLKLNVEQYQMMMSHLETCNFQKPKQEVAPLDLEHHALSFSASSLETNYKNKKIDFHW